MEHRHPQKRLPVFFCLVRERNNRNQQHFTMPGSDYTPHMIKVLLFLYFVSKYLYIIILNIKCFWVQKMHVNHPRPADNLTSDLLTSSQSRNRVLPSRHSGSSPPREEGPQGHQPWDRCAAASQAPKPARCEPAARLHDRGRRVSSQRKSRCWVGRLCCQTEFL